MKYNSVGCMHACMHRLGAIDCRYMRASMCVCVRVRVRACVAFNQPDFPRTYVRTLEYKACSTTMPLNYMHTIDAYGVNVCRNNRAQPPEAAGYCTVKALNNSVSSELHATQKHSKTPIRPGLFQLSRRRHAFVSGLQKRPPDWFDDGLALSLPLPHLCSFALLHFGNLVGPTRLGVSSIQISLTAGGHLPLLNNSFI